MENQKRKNEELEERQKAMWTEVEKLNTALPLAAMNVGLGIVSRKRLQRKQEVIQEGVQM